uniref:Uncharacterized protein n=1 Tax=Anopheles culicifacies TaxID=139723 RepID=A0A182MCT9_9DIPT
MNILRPVGKMVKTGTYPVKMATDGVASSPENKFTKDDITLAGAGSGREQLPCCDPATCPGGGPTTSYGACGTTGPIASIQSGGNSSGAAVSGVSGTALSHTQPQQQSSSAQQQQQQSTGSCYPYHQHFHHHHHHHHCHQPVRADCHSRNGQIASKCWRNLLYLKFCMLVSIVCCSILRKCLCLLIAII